MYTLYSLSNDNILRYCNTISKPGNGQGSTKKHLVDHLGAKYISPSLNV